MKEELFYQKEGNTIDSYSVQSYLRATPFIKNTEINFDHHLTEDFFFQNFYCEKWNRGGKAKDENDEFDKSVSDALRIVSTNTIHISSLNIRGYGGCGKTTYVHHKLREIKLKTTDKSYFDYVTLDFEKVNSIDTVIAQAINKTIKDNPKAAYDYLVKANGEHSEYDISDLGASTWFKNYSFYLNIYLNTLVKELDKYEKTNSRIYHLDIIKEKIEKHNTENNITIEDSYKQYLQFLLTTLFLLKLRAHDIQEPNESVLVFLFDNIDSIKKVREELVFINVMSTFLAQLEAFFDTNKDVEFLGKSKFVWLMTTRIVTSQAFREFTVDDEDNHYWHEVTMPLNYYSHLDILNHRIDKLIELENNKDSKVIDDLVKIREFAKTAYHSSYFKKIYNGNIRYCINALIDFTTKDKYHYLVNQANALWKQYEKTSKEELKEGTNGYILALLLNRFKENGIFESKLHLSTCQPDGKISLSRIILTILHESHGQMCSMLDLFRMLPNNYIDEEKELQTIIDLAEGNRKVWRRLLVMDTFSGRSADSLKNEYDAFTQGNTREKDYTKLAITYAGNIYIEKIVPHFEFMLLRNESNYNKTLPSDKSKSPLFDKTSLIVLDKNANLNQDKYRFESKIKMVYQDVRDCCFNAHSFDISIMQDMTSTAYMNNTHFNFRASGVFNGERIRYHQSYQARLIFAHVGYIERYRRYLIWNERDIEKMQDINFRITQLIMKYLDLYKDLPDYCHNALQDGAWAEMSYEAEKIINSLGKNSIAKIEVEKLRNYEENNEESL